MFHRLLSPLEQFDMAAQDDIDGSLPVQIRRLEEIGVDPLTTVVSDNTRVDFLSGPRLASSDAGVMRILLRESEEMNAVLGRPCVEKLQDQYLGLEQAQPLSEKCTITPLDATPFPTTIFCRPQVGDRSLMSFFKKIHFSQPAKIFDDPTARQAWVCADGDWPAFLLRDNGGVQLHNVYTRMTVDVLPLSFTGLR